MAQASELNVTWEWVAAPGVMAPELRETWARIQISIGDDWITLVQDHASGASRRSIYAPLYPLAEWIAYNWWFLKADSRPVSYYNVSRGRGPKQHRDVLRSLYQRHGLRSSGDGFLWPDLLIIPEGRETRLIWSRDRTSSREYPTRFISQGEAQVEAASVGEKLAFVVAGVIERLEGHGVHGTPLATEWQTIQAADEEEIEFCLAAARLGLDPYCDAREFEPEILRAAQKLRSGSVPFDLAESRRPPGVASQDASVGDDCRSSMAFTVSAAVARRNGGSAEVALAEELPWLTWLPDTERRACIRELLGHLVTEAETGEVLPFARALTAWHSTAVVRCDPELARELQGPFPGDGLEVSRPLPGT
ncbi:hypothetical protein [Microbispora amethystogenes]|uniref:Uncharacterized protein n=1 Tax=Microbispora amethystogenes TaxID=1427754 RepID=A0ABQ4FG82_9ACTN|nr:hypothetical protein [Microbispora amethystogenes]GIH33816.1 hypothetical protein Mam01_39800 [Microbispora amethystogenes]